MLAARDVEPWALAVFAATGISVFLALALAVKARTGRESLTYYHHEIAILAACALAAELAHLPVLASLDAVVLGIGAFLALGRIGCLHAGCCYGAPARHGVRYGPGHVAIGFPSELSGVRLAPIQAVEAAIAATITLTGIACVAAGTAPGVALAVYVAAYGVARFVLEEFRGDAVRRYALGFSEAQWTSLALVTLAAVSGPSPRAPAALATATIAAGMLALPVWRRSRRATATCCGASTSSQPSGRRARRRGNAHLARPRPGRSPPLRLLGRHPRRRRALAERVLVASHPHGRPELVESHAGVLHALVRG